MKYRVQHITSYAYQEAVSFCQSQAHLTPRECAWQRCLSTSLTIDIPTATNQSRTDYFGNTVHHFAIELPHNELTVTAQSVVDVRQRSVPAASATMPWEQARAELKSPRVDANFNAAQFTYESPFVRMLPEAKEYGLKSFTPKRPLLEAALDLTQRIWRDFRYDTKATDISTPTSELFRTRRGLCQDFGHLQICCLRSIGLAARYVSGYLLTDPPPGQPKLVGSDASHAWISVFCPGHGWFDFDPTNNQMPQTRHVTVAWGRDYGDVSPLSGVFLGGGDHRMFISVDVAPAPADAP